MSAPATALARVFIIRRCCRCKVEKPAEEFAPTQGRCRLCQNAYNKDRMAAIRAGTWKPRVKRAARPFPAPVARSVPVLRQPQPRDEAMLRAYLEAFMVEFGFTALKVTYARLEGELSKKHRLDLAREGWIA